MLHGLSFSWTSHWLCDFPLSFYPILQTPFFGRTFAETGVAWDSFPMVDCGNGLQYALSTYPISTCGGQGILRSCLLLWAAFWGAPQNAARPVAHCMKGLGSTWDREYCQEDHRKVTSGQNCGPCRLRELGLRRGAFWSFPQWEAHGYAVTEGGGKTSVSELQGECPHMNLDNAWSLSRVLSVRYFLPGLLHSLPSSVFHSSCSIKASLWINYPLLVVKSVRNPDSKQLISSQITHKPW